MENSVEVLQKIKNMTTLWSSNLGTYVKEMELGSLRDTCTTMFIAAAFTTFRTWKQPKCLSVEKENVIYGCVCINTIQPCERRKSCHFWHIDEHIDAKWNKPGGERKILNLDFIICGILKNTPETESRKLWPGSREK